MLGMGLVFRYLFLFEINFLNKFKIKYVWALITAFHLSFTFGFAMGSNEVSNGKVKIMNINYPENTNWINEKYKKYRNFRKVLNFPEHKYKLIK